MIHELTMKNWVKHHNRTFNFQEGMNLIKGENEGGKSLILEGIDFAYMVQWPCVCLCQCTQQRCSLT